MTEDRSCFEDPRSAAQRFLSKSHSVTNERGRIFVSVAVANWLPRQMRNNQSATSRSKGMIGILHRLTDLSEHDIAITVAARIF